MISDVLKVSTMRDASIVYGLIRATLPTEPIAVRAYDVVQGDVLDCGAELTVFPMNYAEYDYLGCQAGILEDMGPYWVAGAIIHRILEARRKYQDAANL